MVSDNSQVRIQNKSTVLKSIIDEKSISRSSLSKLTGINKVSISDIIKDLISEQLVIETGIGSSSAVGGRKPVLLEFNPRVAKIISLDIASNYISGTLTYLDGSHINSYNQKNITVTKSNVLALVNKAVHDLCGYRLDDVIGMSIAIHGVVKNKKIIFTPYYDLDEIDLYSQLSPQFTFPVYLENEANLSALGEYTFQMDSENLVSISIHSGIGAGIVIKGKVQKGYNGETGEVGHSILFPNGKSCPCGNKGCLEQYASSEAVYKLAKKSLGLNQIDSNVLSEEYYRHNLQIVDILETNAFYLSIGINNISNIFDPHTIIINSSIYAKIPELLTIVTNNLDSRFTKKLMLKNSPLGKNGILLGGVALVSQNYLNISSLKML